MKTVIFILTILILLSFVAYYYSSDKIQFDQISLSFLSASISVLIAVILINYYLEDEKRKRWKKLSGKVNEVLSNMFWDLFSYVDFITDPPNSNFWPKVDDAISPYELYHRKLKAKHKSSRITIHPERFDGLLDEEIGWGKYYENTKREFDELEIKYLEFISPETLYNIIEIEKILTSISSGIRIIQDSIKRGEEESGYIISIKESTEDDHKKIFAVLTNVIQNIDFFEIHKTV
ncbi:MAG: hypothetical protein PHI73_00425 [Patescibacteria group bacterium]|nr:hypothetical protein [Patescibacteria group bacterium]